MHEAIYTEEYKGCTINIYHDTDANNPFEDWDCNPPIAVNAAYNRGIDEYSTQYGNVNTCPELTREQIKKNLSAILSLLDVQSVWALRDSSYEANLVPIINDRLSEHVDNQSNSDRLEVLAELYNMADQPAIVRSVHGYSQGDYAEVLAVATPKFQEACGNAPDYWIGEQGTKDLETSIQLFGDWAFGNVYGFVVKDKHGEQVGSCWRFFGDYDAKDYSALQEARDQVDWYA